MTIEIIVYIITVGKSCIPYQKYCHRNCQINPEYCLQLRDMIVFMTNMTLLVDKKWLTQIQDVREAFCSRIKAGLSTCAQVL